MRPTRSCIRRQQAVGRAQSGRHLPHAPYQRRGPRARPVRFSRVRPGHAVQTGPGRALYSGHGDAAPRRTRPRLSSGYRATEHRRGPGVHGERHDHGADHHERAAQEQAQEEVQSALHLIDVAGHAGDEGAGAHAVSISVKPRPLDVLHTGRGAGWWRSPRPPWTQKYWAVRLQARPDYGPAAAGGRSACQI